MSHATDARKCTESTETVKKTKETKVKLLVSLIKRHQCQKITINTDFSLAWLPCDSELQHSHSMPVQYIHFVTGELCLCFKPQETCDSLIWMSYCQRNGCLTHLKEGKWVNVHFIAFLKEKKFCRYFAEVSASSGSQTSKLDEYWQ